MPKYTVNVTITNSRRKDLTIHARDEHEAEARAAEIVSKWDGVDDIEVNDVTRED